MKKIIIYFLVSTFLISQDKIEETKDIPSNSEIQAEAEVETVAPVEAVVSEKNTPEEVKPEETVEFEKCDANDSDKISGLTYFDFTYSDDKGIYDIKRSYLTYNKDLSDKHKFKMVLDVGRDTSGDDTDERLSAYLKQAQITINPNTSSSFYLGIIEMNMFDVQQKTWGYRYIAKSAMNEYGFSSIADLGFGYKLKLKKFMLSTLLTNGEGYKSSGTDEFQKISLQFLYGNSNLRSIQSGKAFNVGLALSFEPFKNSYLYDSNGGELTDDGNGVYSDLLSKDFEGMNSVVSLFGGFTMQTFMGGLEVNMLNSFDGGGDDGGYSIDFGNDGLEFGNDDTFTSSSTYGDLKTSSLISTYFSFGLTPKFNMFLRADMYDENTAADSENDSETCVLLGFHFPLYDYMDLAPVIKYNIIESEDDPSIDFGVNFQFKF